MSKDKAKVKFVRIRGRIVPIKSKSGGGGKPKSKNLKAASYGDTVKSNRRAYKKDIKTKRGKDLARKHSMFLGGSLVAFAAPLASGNLMRSSNRSGNAARKSGKDILKSMKKGGKSSVKTSSKLKFAGLFAKHKATRGLAHASKLGFAASIGLSIAATVVAQKRGNNISKIRDKDLARKGKRAHFMAR